MTPDERAQIRSLVDARRREIALAPMSDEERLERRRATYRKHHLKNREKRLAYWREYNATRRNQSTRAA